MPNRFPCLLAPGKIGSLTIPNRVVKAPQSTGLSNMDGSVSERLIRHYRELARGGTGLIVVEYAFVDKKASKSAHCQLGICDNEHIPGLAWLAETIKDEGVRAGIQIEHCGRQKFLGTPPIKSASDVTWPSLYDRVGKDAVPEVLTIPEIEEIVEAFGVAAWRAKTAGFELVEIHGAHGYLITNFLSPHTNKRTDVYGGSLENRMRLLLQVYDAVRRYVGDDFPVTVRLSGSDYEPDGFGIEETIEVSKALEARGINAIHVSGGDHHQMIHQVSPMAVDIGHNVWAADRIRKMVKVPVIASGSITTPEFAESILAEGKGDYVGLGRPLWADQYWVRKLEAGKPEEIRPCIRCNEGCLERTFFKFRAVTCGVNPTIGREGEIDIHTNGGVKKNIAIVGGGPAGMEAARVLKLKGHKVTLFEKRSLGGALNEASVPKFKVDLVHFLTYQKQQMKALDINVVEKAATSEELKRGKFDTVILATGAKPVSPSVPGIDRTEVVNAVDVLNEVVPTGNKVIIVGGGLVGTETALWLQKQGKEVVIVEMLDQIMSDCAVTDKIALGEMLATTPIKVMTGWRLNKIDDHAVVVETWNGSHRQQTIQGDSIVIATGYTPNDDLTEQLQQNGKVDVYRIGDCVCPGKVFDAIHTAYKTALKI